MEIGDLSKWNPMEEDFRNRQLNRYREGVGQDLQSRDISDVGRDKGSGGHKPVVLYVTNIPLEMDEISLQNVFEQEGKVMRVSIPKPSGEKVALFNSKIGFVTMHNVRGAQNAIENLNGFQVKGRSLGVKVKQSKEEITRRKDRREREKEFYESLKQEQEDVAGGTSSGARPAQGGSGDAELQGAFRDAGSCGDAASVASSLSIMVHKDSKKVQDVGGKEDLLPLPNSKGAAALKSPGRGRDQVFHPSPSAAGSNVGSDVCANCQKEASLRCKACREVYYCNANCQRAHWPVHRRTCTYETRVPAAPAKPPSTTEMEPDFDNLEVDISEDFMKDISEDFMNNPQAYLKEWLSNAAARSDTSSSSGDHRQKTRPQFFDTATPRPRPDPDGERNQTSGQQNGQLPPDSVVGMHQKNGNARPEGGAQKRTGPQGMEGKAGNRVGPGSGQGQLMATQFQQRKEGPQDDSCALRDQSDQWRRDGPGWQPDWKGLNQNIQADRTGQLQRRNGPQGDQPTQCRNGPQQGNRPSQFQSRNGPPQGDRPYQFRNGPQQRDKPNQFQPRNGPRQGNRPYQFRNRSQQRDKSNQFQPRNGPPQGDRASQYQPRNGPPQDRATQSGSGQGDRPSQFQPRSGPQEDKPDQPRSGPQQGGGPASRRLGDRGNKFREQRQDGCDPQQSGGGQQRGPRKTDSARSPSYNRQNQNQSGQYPHKKDGGRGGFRNNRGPGRQQQEKGNTNNHQCNNKRQRKERGGADCGPRSNADALVKGEVDSWEDAIPKLPSDPKPSATATSPSAIPAAPSPAGAECGKVPAVHTSVDVASKEASIVETSLEAAGSDTIVAQSIGPVSLQGDPLEVVELNTPIRVIVSHLDSPQHFWVQVLEHVQIFVPFVTHVLASYAGWGQPATEADAGQLFLCEFMGELARAKVVSMTGANVKIFYIDYGNSEEVQISQLLPVPAEIASLPALSLPCRLQVCPSEGREWSAEVITVMKGLFSETEVCTLTVLNKQPNICEVSLVRESDGLDATVLLKEKGFGVDPPEVPSSLGKPHRILIRDMAKVTDELTVGQRVDVVFLDTSGPMDIFVRIASMENDFTHFSSRLLAYYNNEPPAPYQPVVGEMVVGHFSGDHCWYRAEVLDVFPESQDASLLYVDYGNKERLPFEEMRALKAEHAATPIQGVSCTIGGISAPADGQWQEDHMVAYVSCLNKYLQQVDEVPQCTVLVECIKEGKVWVDMVSEQLQNTLSEELSQLLEAALLPQPMQPQVLSPVPSTSPVLSEPVIRETEEPAANQPALMSPVQLDRLTLSDGDCLEVGIQEIESCHKFYVNLKTAEGELTMLKENLNKMCGREKQAELQACSSVVPGDLVLVQFSLDEEWYRGCVEQVSDDGNTCSVIFVDYGNKEDKQVASLNVMPPQFLALPAQAVACQLAGVPSSVPQEVEQMFHELCYLTEAVVKVVGREVDCYIVEVFTTDNQSVTEVLKLQPTPVPIHPTSEPDTKVSSAALCPLLEDNESKEAPHSSFLCPPLEEVDIRVAQAPCAPVEEEDGPGFCVSDAPSQPTTLSSTEATETRLTRDCLQVVAANEESLKKMMVTYVVNPAHFYVAPLDYHVGLHDTGSLVPQLQEWNETCPPLPHFPFVGEVLSGLFDGEWFRCEVLEINGSRVRINFFDYGNEAVVDLSDLHPLPQHLCCNFPLTTFRCCLEGIRCVNGENWDGETALLTKELMENKIVSLEVKAVRDDIHHVKVTRIKTGEDVGQLLVESGKAVALTAPSNNSQREELLRQMQELKAKLAAMETTQ